MDYGCLPGVTSRGEIEHLAPQRVGRSTVSADVDQSHRALPLPAPRRFRSRQFSGPWRRELPPAQLPGSAVGLAKNRPSGLATAADGSAREGSPAQDCHRGCTCCCWGRGGAASVRRRGIQESDRVIGCFDARPAVPGAMQDRPLGGAVLTRCRELRLAGLGAALPVPDEVCPPVPDHCLSNSQSAETGRAWGSGNSPAAYHAVIGRSSVPPGRECCSAPVTP